MSPGDRQPQILVAAIGNAWMRDDGFGIHVAKRLEDRELPQGVGVFDFGTGGLDLAYEVMRGYDALVLVDVIRQGGEPLRAPAPGLRKRNAPRQGGGNDREHQTLTAHDEPPPTWRRRSNKGRHRTWRYTPGRSRRSAR